MAASLPYPDKPANGQAPDADPLRLNFLALLQAIQAFDASQIVAGSVADAAFATNVNPRLRDGAWMANWIESGGYTASFTGLQWTMPSGVAWVSGYRTPFTGQTYTVAISSDIYYYVNQNGVVASSAVANNATAPALPASNTFLAKVVSNATAITGIVDLRNLTPLVGTTPAWITPTLAGAWTNYGAPFGTPGYMKDALGFVHLKGLVKSGAVGSTIFTLPAGYRPAEQLIFAGLGDGAVVRVDVLANGVVQYGLGAATSTYTSLQNIYFKAEL